MIKIVHAGHWDKVPDGWLDIPESQQDLTQKLRLQDDSVDVLFNEHAWEHLPFTGAIFFAKESLRVLKPGGILRVVTPMVDRLVQFKNDSLGKHYSDIQLHHYFVSEDNALKELGLSGIREEPLSFLFDSLLKGHNHRHVWTSSLLVKVLFKVGFSEVYVCPPGQSVFDQSNCLERVIRGVDETTLKEQFGMQEYDPETLVVEAKK